MPPNNRRKTYLRKQRLRKARSVRAKRGAATAAAAAAASGVSRIVGHNPLDIYSIGSTIGNSVDTADNCTITSYSELKDPRLVIQTYRYTASPATLKNLALTYNKLYNRLHGLVDGVIYKTVCFDANYAPTGFVVKRSGSGSSGSSSKSGGALCSYPDLTYTAGEQIGKNDQGGQNADSLYLETSDNSLLIKRLTGEGNPNPGLAYAAIYSELKITQRAAAAGVAPPVIYTKIVSDADLMPVGFLVMERIMGKYTSQTEVRQNAAEIHRLIDLLQTNKISHNDLHNRNILLGYTDSSPEPRIWVIDYGSARLDPTIVPDAHYRIAITFDGPNAHSSYKAFETV